MSKIDYSKYNITATSQFEKGLSQLKDNHCFNEIKKIFTIIEEIIEDVDMYEKEYARPLRGSNKMQHIHLDGRTTGDIILLYRVDGKDIDIDLRLYNITKHRDLDRYSNPKFTAIQNLSDFNVITHKYSQEQLDYVEQCYLAIIGDYRFHKLVGEAKSTYTDNYIDDYMSSVECDVPITRDEFVEILYYFQNVHNRNIFASLNLSQPQRTPPITERESDYILNLFDINNVEVIDAYIETETDKYGDIYEYMYVSARCNDFRQIKLLESDLYSLDNLFEILFTNEPNGYGRYGQLFQFSHYFE